MDEDTGSVDDGAVSRRRLMKRMGAAGAIAWTAPSVLRFNPASAQTGGSPFSPNPECEGSTCGGFQQCSSTNPDCICATTSSGGGFCIPGSTICADLETCGAGNTCPPGTLCVVDTCCGRPVCLAASLNDECPAEPTSRSAGPVAARTLTGAGTVGG